MSSIANDCTDGRGAASSAGATAYTGTDSGESVPPVDASLSSSSSSSSSSSLRGSLRDSFAAAVSSTTAVVSQQMPGGPKNRQQQQQQHHHRKLVVMDCRPKVNAMANKVKGGGVESVTRHSGKVS
jgi:hypothetical protein